MTIQDTERAATHIKFTLPRDWRAAIEKAAAARGEHVAEFIRRAIRKELPASVRATLSEPAPRGRPTGRTDDSR